MRLTGAEAIVKTLENLGVTHTFGMPGGAILPTFDPLMDSKIRHILIRHEQGAGHAAEGYAISTGETGCAIVTSGPGATNTLTALADAHLDSVPIVIISGQVGTNFIGTDAFQEADIIGASMPISKHGFIVRDAKDIPARIVEAFHLARSGRPGPVLVDITKSAQNEEFDFSWPPQLDLPGYTPVYAPKEEEIEAAVELIVNAKKPVLYVGGGLIRAKASEELKELVALTDFPVVTTLPARGAFPDTDPHHLGMPGMHGTVPAVGALQKADLLISLGARFDDRVTGDLGSFAPEAKVVHIDIDAAELSKLRFADVPVHADLKPALQAICKALPTALEKNQKRDLAPWWNVLNRLKEAYPAGWEEPSDGMLAPQHVIRRISDLTGPNAIYVTGVGQHQMWAAQHIDFANPGSFITSAGLGTMGYCIPAAMGAKLGKPDTPVWAIDGDGSFQMTNQELATCVVNNIPIKIALINNSVLGMVRQWQTLFYNQRYSNTVLATEEQEVPNFIKLAEAYGIEGRRVYTETEVEDAIQWALSVNDRPVFIDFRVSKDAQVWPMVAAGVSNDAIQYARGIAPVWEEEI
ncbi:acetolactate synthase large subunit [Gleimia sp. 6138-11-ORH1]|uniref:acetolactate synthase large subunit n=1 Tax=Gleimia sp. 6138-11-ORH1 TaxID=2973937 RepID=UPI0021685D41|nr:acetolactate synthase large subunit [Gleimia sp. 6138-11-ORH1]MCS4484850.1 acetolactate synthase large subunit [Gleimia sp. 6138-11-ORH1]